MKRPAPFAAAVVATALVLANVPYAAAQNDPTYRAILGVGPNDTSVTFSWRSDYPGDEVVKVWEKGTEDVEQVDGSEFDGGAPTYTSRRAAIDGLKPGAQYNYQIGSEEGGWSAINTFTTADGDGKQGVLIYSDVQIGTNLKYDEQTRNWQDAATRGEKLYPDAGLHLYLGDQVEGWGDQIREYDGFFTPNQIRQTPGAALIGNHETFVDGVKHFNEHFVNPNTEWADQNYSFVRENTLFINLNSNKRSDEDIDAHVKFLRKTVNEQGKGKDWIVVSFHHPMFSPTYNSLFDAGLTDLQDRLEPVLSELGVNLVLNGHDHIYSRSHLIENGEVLAPEKRAQIGDVIEQRPGQVMYIALNTGTNSKYTDFYDENRNSYPNYTREQAAAEGLEREWQAFWQQDYNPDFTYLDIAPGYLTVRTHNVYSQELVDEVTLLKPGAEAPQPYDPKGVEVPTSPVVAPTVTTTVTTTTTQKETTTAEVTTTATATQTVTATETAPTTVPITVTETEGVTETAKTTATETEQVTATKTETEPTPATITPTETVTQTITVTETPTPATTTVVQTVAAEPTASGSSDNGRCIASIAGFGVPFIIAAAAATVGLPMVEGVVGPYIQQAIESEPALQAAADQLPVSPVAVAAGLPAVALLLLTVVFAATNCGENSSGSAK